MNCLLNGIFSSIYPDNIYLIQFIYFENLCCPCSDEILSWISDLSKIQELTPSINVEGYQGNMLLIPNNDMLEY